MGVDSISKFCQMTLEFFKKKTKTKQQPVQSSLRILGEMDPAGSIGCGSLSLAGGGMEGIWGIPEVYLLTCDNMEDLCHSLVLNLGNIKSHCLYHRNDPQNKQDELWHVVVFSSGSIIFGFQESSFVLKCPALGSISEERS